MTDIVQNRATAAPAAIIGIAAALGTGQVNGTDDAASWPTLEVPPYVTNHESGTVSLREKSVAFQIPYVAQNFRHQIADIYAALLRGQEPLESDFEAVWDANVSQLYES